MSADTRDRSYGRHICILYAVVALLACLVGILLWRNARQEQRFVTRDLVVDRLLVKSRVCIEGERATLVLDNRPSITLREDYGNLGKGTGYAELRMCMLNTGPTLSLDRGYTRAEKRAATSVSLRSWRSEAGLRIKGTGYRQTAVPTETISLGIAGRGDDRYASMYRLPEFDKGLNAIYLPFYAERAGDEGSAGGTGKER
jgi:hypothetical protein